MSSLVQITSITLMEKTEIKEDVRSHDNCIDAKGHGNIRNIEKVAGKRDASRRSSESRHLVDSQRPPEFVLINHLRERRLLHWHCGHAQRGRQQVNDQGDRVNVAKWQQQKKHRSEAACHGDALHKTKSLLKARSREQSERRQHATGKCVNGHL